MPVWFLQGSAGSGSGVGSSTVATIADRDLLTDLVGSQVVHVDDASADPTVDSGSASYRWSESLLAWVKFAEAESLDKLRSVPDDHDTTSSYFYFGWEYTGADRVIRRVTRSSGRSEAATNQVGQSYASAWADRVNQIYQ